MEQRFSGKCALVTGAAQGIGRAVALRLAGEGADVVVADIDAEKAEPVCGQITAMGRSCRLVAVDLAVIDSIREMVEQSIEFLGRIDMFVNCAGIVHNTPLLQITQEDWDRVINVNQRAVAFCTRFVGRHMVDRVPDDVKAQGRSTVSYGKIVNFSSISGRRGRPLQIHYAASKAAVISLTQSAALAFAPYNINVNAVSPGPVRTRMWDVNVVEKGRIFGRDAEKEAEQFIELVPLKRAGTVDDMAAAVAFLCSSDADFITGQTLNVDGGFEMG
ncbi:MAG: glucose 1-dehydrogenase [Spirochaetaceae bacterium]|nr:MAG: glucose 1-dehydrogenase [Spirochaetaceae bacterium]